MRASYGDLSDVGGESLRGGHSVSRGAVSELPVVVRTKGMQGPIGLENEGVLLTPKAGAKEKGKDQRKYHPISKQAQPGQGMEFVSQAAHLGF